MHPSVLEVAQLLAVAYLRSLQAPSMADSGPEQGAEARIRAKNEVAVGRDFSPRVRRARGLAPGRRRP